MAGTAEHLRLPGRRVTGDVALEADAFTLVRAGALMRLAGALVALVAGIATTALALRLLGTTSYGMLAFALSAVTIVAGVSRIGLDAAIARTTAALDADGDGDGLGRLAAGVVTVVGLATVVGACLTTAVVVLGPVALGGTSLLVFAAGLAVYLAATNAAAVAAALARGRRRVVLMEAPGTLLSTARLVAVVLLFALAADTLAPFGLAYGAAGLVTLALSVALVHRLTGRRAAFRPSLRRAGEVVALAAPFAATGAAVVVVARFDVLVLGLTGTGAEVGVYEPALKLAEQALLVTLLFVSPYLPVATRLVRRRDAVAVQDLLRTVSMVAYILALPVVVLLAAFPKEVLHAVYGSSYPVREEVVWILLCGFAASLAAGLSSSTVTAYGNAAWLARNGAVAIGTMVASALLLIPAFGPVGAASATAVTYGAMAVAAMTALWRDARVHVLSSRFAVVVLSSPLPVLGAVAASSLFADPPLVAAVAVALAAWAAWVVLIVIARALTPAEVRRLVRT